MKRFLSLLLITLAATSCGNSDTSTDRVKKEKTIVSNNQMISEVKVGDFVLQIISEKSAYKVNEDVKISARLKYVGKGKKQKIFHAASPFTFGVFEANRKIGLLSVMDQPLLSSELKRDEWLEKPHTKSAVYLNDDPNIDFQKEYMQNPGFPAGEYRIKVTADFFVKVGDEEVDYKFSTKDITVTVTD
jgi:hypothetical protein